MRRATLLAGTIAGALLTLAPTAAAARSDAWSRSGARIAVREGLVRPFKDGSRGFTATQLRTATGGLARHFGVAPVAVPQRRVSVRAFHRAVVLQLGLGDVAAHVLRETRDAGLRPPPDFGTEVMARWLELRYNHPEGRSERRELYPWDTITRAEAAYSLGVAARLKRGEIAEGRRQFSAYRLPRLTGAKRRALRLAVKRIGMPYIWGGMRDRTGRGQLHGGFDCSGLVWRVFKTSGLRAGRKLHARTSSAQAHEIPRSSRIRLSRVRAGDLVFLKWQGAIYHVGIALSHDWVIHSADQGVHVLPLQHGWFRDEFAWARRVI